MVLQSARDMARQLMRRHGMGGWQLVFDNAKTRAGVCRPARRQIGLSRVLTALHSEDEVRDTLLHEIAHALVGAEHGHDAVWRAKAAEIGCSATRCVPVTSAMAPAPWTGRCPAGHETSRHRRPTRVLTCGQCSPTFDAAQVFAWRLHGQVVPMHPVYVAELARLRVGGASPDERPTPARPRPVVLPVGARVRLAGAGRFAGVVGTIEKRARTRYHVRTPVGLVAAPFELVREL